MTALPRRVFDAGTLAGAGTFRCERCGFPVGLREVDQVPACPHCGSRRFKRASMFSDQTLAEPWSMHHVERPEWLADARRGLDPAGHYLAYQAGEGQPVQVVPLVEEWTRIGRSLAAHVRFDHPTVSRRHALVHSDQSGARVLDDRSLNGVLVNGERVESCDLRDGDEITVGRFRIYFLSSAAGAPGGGPSQVGTTAR